MALARSAPFDQICCTALSNKKAFFTIPLLRLVKNGILQLVDFFLFAVKQQRKLFLKQEQALFLQQEQVE